MPTLARGALIVLLVAMATACSEPTYSPPAAKTVEPTSPPISPPLAFPALSKPGTIYTNASPSEAASRAPLIDRYVLYNDGTHSLQMSNSLNVFEYKGTWTRADSTISFEWEGWSVAGPWGATGTVRGDQLVVRYNLIMQLTDFEDAIYVRAQNGS